MGSAVQKLHRHIIIILFVGYFLIWHLVAFLYQPLAAETIEQNPTADKKKETMVSLYSGHITLDRKLERVAKTIQFIWREPAKLAEPTFFHLGNRDLPVKELVKKLAIPLSEKYRDSGLIIPPAQKKTTDTLNNHLIDGSIQSISLDKNTYYQGEIAILNVTAVLPLRNPKIKFLSQTYKLYPVSNNTYNTILAVPMDTKPDSYYMTLKYEDCGEQKNLKLPFKIIEGDFAKEDTADFDIHILTEEILEMLKYEGNYFAKAYNINPDSILFEGAFILPCAGTITGLYGTPRRYNKNLDEWSHKAIDISNAPGTKVVASNNGIVAMAKNLDVHGNSIVIAHGQGIHTVYLHLSKMNTEEGDTVKKGQVIGLLGKTGLCTGPNLHWQIMVNRIATDPRYWVKLNIKLAQGLYVKSEWAGNKY